MNDEEQTQNCSFPNSNTSLFAQATLKLNFVVRASRIQYMPLELNFHSIESDRAGVGENREVSQLAQRATYSVNTFANGLGNTEPNPTFISQIFRESGPLPSIVLEHVKKLELASSRLPLVKVNSKTGRCNHHQHGCVCMRQSLLELQGQWGEEDQPIACQDESIATITNGPLEPCFGTESTSGVQSTKMLRRALCVKFYNA